MTWKPKHYLASLLEIPVRPATACAEFVSSLKCMSLPLAILFCTMCMQAHAQKGCTMGHLSDAVLHSNEYQTS